MLSRISKVAPTDSGVLITGETGTGKESVARAIHRLHGDSYPFVSLNCAVIPRDLIASELFGHEMGAFTGAAQRRLGRFELAEGGTLFLDEVGELPAETQITLLRVLQEHEFGRIGGAGSIRADVRVIAATNRDLEAAIARVPLERPILSAERLSHRDAYASGAKGRHPASSEVFPRSLWEEQASVLRQSKKGASICFKGIPGRGISELQNVIERSVIVSETPNFFSR